MAILKLLDNGIHSDGRKDYFCRSSMQMACRVFPEPFLRFFSLLFRYIVVENAACCVVRSRYHSLCLRNTTRGKDLLT